MPSFDPMKREAYGHLQPASQNGQSKRKKTTSQRWQALNEFVDGFVDQLNRSELRTFMWLFRHADSNNVVQASQGQIAKCVGLSRRAVVDAMRKLENLHAIKCIWRSGLNQSEGSKFAITTATSQKNA